MLPMLTDLTMALDPARLFQRAMGYPPDPWQVGVLRSSAPQVLLNCSRQAGKSTAVAVLALHAALYQAPALILAVSPSLRQSQELFRKVVDGYRALGSQVAPMAEGATRLELTNNSRIVALPGSEATIRGFSGVSLLLVDEASRVPDDVYFAIRPMLAVSGGRIIALSTPFGTRGWWYQEWTAGGAAWSRVEVPATMVPRISPVFLEEERRTLGGWWYAQEYECQFSDTIDQVFSTADIERAVVAGIEPLEW